MEKERKSQKGKTLGKRSSKNSHQLTDDELYTIVHADYRKMVIEITDKAKNTFLDQIQSDLNDFVIGVKKNSHSKEIKDSLEISHSQQFVPEMNALVSDEVELSDSPHDQCPVMPNLTISSDDSNDLKDKQNSPQLSSSVSSQVSDATRPPQRPFKNSEIRNSAKPEIKKLYPDSQPLQDKERLPNKESRENSDNNISANSSNIIHGDTFELGSSLESPINEKDDFQINIDDLPKNSNKVEKDETNYLIDIEEEEDFNTFDSSTTNPNEGNILKKRSYNFMDNDEQGNDFDTDNLDGIV